MMQYQNKNGPKVFITQTSLNDNLNFCTYNAISIPDIMPCCLNMRLQFICGGSFFHRSLKFRNLFNRLQYMSERKGACHAHCKAFIGDVFNVKSITTTLT